MNENSAGPTDARTDHDDAPTDAAAGGFLVLVNARAGGADADAVDPVVAELARHGPVRRVDTADAADLDAALDLGDQARPVVVGGDGSLHAAVAALHRRGELPHRPLALVPLGTGNDLARAVDLPLEPVKAAAVAATGRLRRLDLLVDDAAGVVVNAAHAGVGSEAAQRAAGFKEGLGPLAYPLGALLAGTGEEGWALEVAVDDEPVPGDGPVLLVAAHNGPTIGGGTPLCPPADPADGLLDVLVVRSCAPAARAAFAAALRGGTHLDRDDVVHRRGRRLTVTGDAARYAADGEVSDPVTRRRYDVAPAAWWLVVPRPGARAGVTSDG